MIDCNDLPNCFSDSSLLAADTYEVFEAIDVFDVDELICPPEGWPDPYQPPQPTYGVYIQLHVFSYFVDHIFRKLPPGPTCLKTDGYNNMSEVFLAIAPPPPRLRRNFCNRYWHVLS